MDLHVSLAGRGDLAARIYQQLRAAIVDGRLRAGERLPATRELAGRLAVSRNTVAAAYERLVAEGFLVGRVGAGTYVCERPPTRAAGRAAPTGKGIQPRPAWRELPADMVGSRLETAYNFGVGIPDAGLFPLDTWRRLVAAELRPAVLRGGAYADPGGADT